MRRPLRIAALVALGLALGAVLLEWTLDALNPLQVGRLADFRTLAGASVQASGEAHWRLEPGCRLLLGENQFVVYGDEAGRRGMPGASKFAAPPLRIVGIGDGAVFGWGVDSERTALFRLQLELQDRVGAARRVEVFNLGHPFHTERQLGDALRVATEELRADLVLVFGRAAGLGLTAEFRSLRDQAGADPRGPFARLMPTLADLVSGRAVTGALGDDPEAIAPLAEVLTAVGRVRDGGHQVAFVSLGARPPSDVSTRCAEQGVPLIVADAEQDAGGAPVYVDARNRWPNAAGQTRIAEAVLAALEFDGERGLLEIRSTAR